MKRILSFSELSPAFQKEAIYRVSRIAVGRTHYCGEVWSETSLELARRARFVMSVRAGNYSGIYNIVFSTLPKIVPGTEFHLKK
jgi:hypothetical protein